MKPLRFKRLEAMARAIALALAPSLVWAVDPNAASNSIMGYAWRIANFICGVSAIFVIADIAWHARDMSEYGKRVKAGFLALGLLGCLYAVAAFILGSASAQGTSVSGLDTAMNMKP